MRDGIEAGTGETEGLDAKRESPATRSGTRPNPWFTTPNPILEGVELREAYARVREALDVKAEREKFCNWWRSWCPDRDVPPVTSHIMDAWLASARETLKATPLIGLSQGEGEARARELLAAEYDAAGVAIAATALRDGTLGETTMIAPALAAIVAALSTVQDGSVREDGADLAKELRRAVHANRTPDPDSGFPKGSLVVGATLPQSPAPISGDAS